jgi:hypothetical protein
MWLKKASSIKNGDVSIYIHLLVSQIQSLDLISYQV